MYVRKSGGEWTQEDLPVVTIDVDRFPPLESVVPVLPKKKKK